MAKNNKLWIDMCAGSELKDTQGETLSVEGADIHDLEMGKGRFNDNHGKGFFNSLGRVTEAKKILKREDCDNERHEYYWDKIKAPYVYAKGYLYSDEDHSNAKAAAAILRNIHREDAPLAMKASVEGGVISRGISDSTRLARTKIHSVALTFTPANNATLVEPLNLDKSDTDWASDKQLIKSVMHLAETNIPSFRHIERHASAHTIHENIIKIQELAKSLGIDIEVRTADPEKIMEQALLHKVASNVCKINELVKALALKNSGVGMMEKPKAAEPEKMTLSPGKVKMAQEAKTETKLKARDGYQQKIGQMKGDPTTPKKPVDLNAGSKNMKTQSVASVKQANTFKSHASKAMKNPDHIKSMHKELTDRGIHPDKVKKIISKVQSHMVKSADPDMEKGDIANAAKNLVLAGTMAMGAHSMGKKPVDVKPKTEIKREIASTPKKVSPEEKKKKGREAAKWLSRENLKNKLKKALTAGYGGAGAPSDMTGGSVLQSEALDDGRADKGLDYIVCENCGHEQVYMQHQVKCRDCNKNFSLDKLKGHI